MLLRALGLAVLLLPVVPCGPPGAAERRCFCQVGSGPWGTGRDGAGGGADRALGAGVGGGADPFREHRWVQVSQRLDSSPRMGKPA